MQPPTPPRPEEHGLTSEEAARLSRYALPSPPLPPGTDAVVAVRWLSGERLALLGAALAGFGALYGMLSGGRVSLGGALFALMVAAVLAAPAGAVGGMLLCFILIRPIYTIAAGLLVPGFKAYRQLERAQVAHRQKRVEYEAWRRRMALEFWRSLSGVQFERECAALFKRLGYSVSLTPGTADGGIDIVLRLGTDVTAVQCKALRGKVGISVGRELVTAARDFGATGMMIACTSGPSEPLRSYARQKGIKVVTAQDLIEWQMRLEGMPAVNLQVERVPTPC